MYRFKLVELQPFHLTSALLKCKIFAKHTESTSESCHTCKKRRNCATSQWNQFHMIGWDQRARSRSQLMRVGYFLQKCILTAAHLGCVLLYIFYWIWHHWCNNCAWQDVRAAAEGWRGRMSALSLWDVSRFQKSALSWSKANQQEVNFNSLPISLCR